MAIYAWQEYCPQIHESAWVADSAKVIGQVSIGALCSIWFGAVLRGDNAPISIGARSNVQENCVLHLDKGGALRIGEGVTVGHSVTLHGCHVGDGSLIGIGATVLNNVRIGRHCVVGAGALLTEGKEFADESMILGAPARMVRKITADEIQNVLRHAAEHYVHKVKNMDQLLRRLDGDA